MKIGYPCINRSLQCRSSRTFRLKSFEEERFLNVVENNLNCLDEILDFNLKNNLLFFRISSDLIPFASHPVNKINWPEIFKDKFKEIGEFIKKHDIRISMHPDQFTLINSPDEKVKNNSLAELTYHALVLNSLGLGEDAKMQIHIGGVYGDKKEAMGRFVKEYEKLDPFIRKYLVVENDDRLYSLSDCLSINYQTGVPVLFDVFHHKLLNNGENLKEAFNLFTKTWNEKDGLPMVDYSSQEKDARKGKHAESIDLNDFGEFIEEVWGFGRAGEALKEKEAGDLKKPDFDIMLEIKDKEKSAIKAENFLHSDKTRLLQWQ